MSAYASGRIRTLLLIALMADSLVMLVATNAKPAMAATTISSNTDDNYSGGSWVGLRPQKVGEVVSFNQTVTNYGGDSNVGVMLSAKAGTLLTGSTSCALPGTFDCVGVGFTLATNSRKGIAYGYVGPSALPFPYGIGGGAIDTGIHCGPGCGAWVGLPFPLVLYGAPGIVEYRQVWVSSDGYISVNGPYSNTGKIAPFNRPLTAGHVWYWTGVSNDFFIAWDVVDSVSGTPESFLLRIYSATVLQYSTFQQSGFEFWYSSVTPSDRTPTFVGINDQYGGRSVSFIPGFLVNNQGLFWKATSGPWYLNSLTVTVMDTSSGVTDPNAQVIFDPRYTSLGLQAGDPVGYNMLLLYSVPGTVVLPDYAKQVLSVASLTPASIGTGGMIIATASGLVDVAVDTYNTLLQAYWGPKLAQVSSQSAFGSASPALISAYAAKDGASTPAVDPVDASLGAHLVWLFNDLSRTNPHHMTITATVGYIGGSGSTLCCGPDQYQVQTSVGLDINPDYNVSHENFASGGFNSNSWSATAPWTVLASGQCPMFNGSPNCIAGNLAWSGNQPSTTAPLILKLGNFVNYNQIVIYFHLWVDLNGAPGAGGTPSVSISYLSSGVWQQWGQYAGSPSTSGGRGVTAFTQWINARLVVPSTTTSIGFTYLSGSTAAGQGFYMGDIYIFGDGPGNSADVQVTAQLTTSTGLYHPSPIAMDSGPFYYTTDHFLETLGTPHMLTAQGFFTDSQGSYSFSNWLDGVTSPSRTITVGGPLSFAAAYNLVPDFTVTASPTSLTIPQGSGGISTISVNGRNGFSGSVTVTANPSSAGISASPSPATVTLSTSTVQSSYALTILVAGSVSLGTYTVTVTGTGAGLSSSVTITVNVVCSGCGSGGGGGSVAAGTTIVLANGTQVQVQNLQKGMELLSYDTTANQFTTSTITRFVTVVTNNTMVIQTTAGQPLIMDQNPAQKLYVMLPNGTRTMLSVTLLQPGYYLFDIPTLSWVQITNIKTQTGGNHVMYDVYDTSPGNYVANGYLDPFKI